MTANTHLKVAQDSLEVAHTQNTTLKNELTVAQEDLKIANTQLNETQASFETVNIIEDLKSQGNSNSNPAFVQL